MSILRRGFKRTRQSFFGRMTQLLGGAEIEDETWDDLEAMMIQSDMGVETTLNVIEYLQDEVKARGYTRVNQLENLYKNSLLSLVNQEHPPMNITGRELSVILIVGVNGSGKTTSIAKLANRYKKEGKSVMVAAGDTFRAAAIDQLQRWGERIGVPVIANQPGSDPGAVAFDAVAAAKARGADILIIDTAGRLHNNYNLMKELEKIQGVIQKGIPDAPHEIILVLDGTTGQNALRQGVKFAEAVDITGLIITKLDGTSKGGMLFSVYTELDVPIRYIGLGEGVDDMIPFDPEGFVESLFAED